MATITTIDSTDLITNSRTDINTNFSNLNSDKMELSYLDTDTAMAANSDVKVPSQKAVKAYIDTSGGQNASTTVRGIVEEATQAEVDAGTAAGATGARLFINPSITISTTKSVTAGATINGATLPVPVYQNKTDNEFYACDANDTAAMKFLGFAISNGTDGASMTVKFNGIVSGLSALDEGEKYYVSDTVGTISTTPGTYEILVGVAISTTELLIQRGKRYASGTLSLTSASGNQAITTGFRPSKVRVHATCHDTDESSHSHGVWTVFGGNDCVYGGQRVTTAGNDGSSGVDNTNVYNLTGPSTNFGTGQVTTITDTGFTLTESINSSTVYISWEAEGEL